MRATGYIERSICASLNLLSGNFGHISFMVRSSRRIEILDSIVLFSNGIPKLILTFSSFAPAYPTTAIENFVPIKNYGI